MKIEKLNDNKIRIIINQEDLKDKSLDLHTIMTKAAESQGLFLEILDKAKKEIGFDADGHKLLIEAFSSSENVMVFTITKFKVDQESLTNSPVHKSLKVKRKINSIPKSAFSCYSFNDFEAFCSFCNSINELDISISRLAKRICLYNYEDNFFLVFDGINIDNKNLNKLYSLICEFGSFTTHDSCFEHKLLEYGKCVMDKNAIGRTIRYFCK